MILSMAQLYIGWWLSSEGSSSLEACIQGSLIEVEFSCSFWDIRGILVLQHVYGFKDPILNFLIKFRHVWLNNNASKVIIECLKKLAGWLTLAGWLAGLCKCMHDPVDLVRGVGYYNKAIEEYPLLLNN